MIRIYFAVFLIIFLGCQEKEAEREMSIAKSNKPAKSFWHTNDDRIVRYFTITPTKTYKSAQLQVPIDKEQIMLFVPYRILQPHHKSDCYLLADSNQNPNGWVKAKNGILWLHRQGLGLKRYNKADELANLEHRSGEVTFDFEVDFYRSYEEAISNYGKKKSKQKAYGVIENPKYIAPGFMKWPILEARVAKINGKKIKFYKICIVGWRPNDRIADSMELERAVNQVKLSLKNLDIAFCVDMTRSMTNYHKIFRQNIVQIAREIHRRYPELNIRLGWGAYQDKLGYEHYVGKFFGYFDIQSEQTEVENKQQLEAFCKMVNHTPLLEETSVDYPENVFWGIHQTLQGMDFRPGSRRVLIVCGDDGNHAKNDPKNEGQLGIDEMVEELDKNYVQPFCLYKGPRPLLSEQMNSIINSVKIPKGKVIPVENPQKFLNSLNTLLMESSKVSKEELKSVHDVLGTNERSDAIETVEVDMQKWTMVMKILENRAGGALASEFNVVLNFLQAQKQLKRQVKAGVHAVWIPETVGDIQIVESYEFLSKGELKRLQDYLRELSTLDIREAGDKLRLLRITGVFGDLPMLDQWLRSPNVSEPLDRYLKQKHHITMRTKLLNFTKEELRSMSVTQCRELAVLADKYDDYLDEIRKNQQFWFRIGREQYVWLPSRDLP